ncbi:MAG: methyltransferase domain-containing protein [Candidatus Coatesbacteria bacterium]|nr:MAG: methyltransferase domain-containing protein [Candidatus Coatesbacteria bacterium]
MDVFDWIKKNLNPRVCDSAEFIYDEMDSQSERCLPIIYRPFDTTSRGDWRERGFTFDYLYSTGSGRLLDFGPGDGWPSLNVAPFAGEVVGVDASKRRVEACEENAERLGIENAAFVHVPHSTRLPFPDGHFDGAMAASSVEQTPDPLFALEEIYRVIRPGGRLRVWYEALARYRDGREREVWVRSVGGETAQLILTDRHIDEERADQFNLVFDVSAQHLNKTITGGTGEITLDDVTPEALEEVAPRITDVRACPLRHPSGRTLAAWLADVGFREVLPTESGADAAGSLFDQLAPQDRPSDLEGVDALVKPVVEKAIETPAAIEGDPMITAMK